MQTQRRLLFKQKSRALEVPTSPGDLKYGMSSLKKHMREVAQVNDCLEGRAFYDEKLLPKSCTFDLRGELYKKITCFSETTLLYIYYCMPRDLIQYMAIEALFGKGWQYDRQQRQWIKATPEAETYIAFDYACWGFFEKKYKKELLDLLDLKELTPEDAQS